MHAIRVFLALATWQLYTAQAILNTVSCCRKADAARELHDPNHARLESSYAACDLYANVLTAPTPPVYVPFDFCARECEGESLSGSEDATSWMAPLAQFLLPSIIFSMGIPRRRLFVPTWSLGGGRFSFATSIPLLLLKMIDLVLWVAVIFATAGPLMLSALNDMVLDLNLFSVLNSNVYTGLPSASRIRLMLAIASGNLRQRTGTSTRQCPLAGPATGSIDPLFEMAEAMTHLDRKHRPQKLLDLMDAPADWATTVGYPVLFYIFGFVYASLDVGGAPPSADAPLALTFGVKWMIVVHVAIVSGCLLANGNPSTASALVVEPLVPETQAALPSVYECRFQPVSIWSRGSNKQVWLEQITHHRDGSVTSQPAGSPCPISQEHEMLRDIRQDLKISVCQYLLVILLPAITLTTLPSMAGAYLTHQTVPKGFGCLSLTLACYAGSQILVIFLHELRRHASGFGSPSLTAPTGTTKYRPMHQLRRSVKVVGQRAYCVSLLPLYLMACLISLLIALGEPIMSAAGIYSNCRCFVSVNMWLHLDRAFVPVAFAYDSSPTSYGGWVMMGYVAAAFMGACTYASWYYQHSMKARYRRIVRAL